VRRSTFVVVLAMCLLISSGGTHLMPAEGRLGAARLFSLLDLDGPGMEKVRAAVDDRDLAQAEDQLPEYMRSRDSVRTRIPSTGRLAHQGEYASAEDLAIADDALRHVFGGLYPRPPEVVLTCRSHKPHPPRNQALPKRPPSAPSTR